jgi:hypothetical protein
VLNERRATAVIYDSPIDVTRILVDEPPGTVRTRTVAADLLLDPQGFLVGVDLEPSSPARTVVMIGPHEAVAGALSVRVGVCTDASGHVFEVRVGSARAAIRGDLKNPYA